MPGLREGVVDASKHRQARLGRIGEADGRREAAPADAMRRLPSEAAGWVGLGRIVAEAKIVRCERCGRGLAESYGFMVLVRYRGRRTQFYGPGRVVLTCQVCEADRVVEMQETICR